MASDPARPTSPDVSDVSRPVSMLQARTALPTAATVAGVIAALYFGREVFLPLAIAMLLTFALAPLVSLLRRIHIPRVPAVLCCVVLTFAVLAMFSYVLVTQVGDMARNTATYQANILTKIQNFKASGSSDGIIERVGQAIERVGQEIEREPSAARGATTVDEPDPLKVEVIARQRPIEVLQSLITPLISPLSTTGLIIVVLIFMLLERETLRDRFIRLVGYGDLHRTTQALEDAGRRVGQYLLMQLVVNLLYSIPVGVGLWILGIPNPLLWGLLTLVLRFVPYIGPAIGMLLPLFLAMAVDPGWSLLLWTAGLFLVMELISNNFIEPWLYGSRTGLSPLAVIVAAIFWTWLWGPLGLVLSTPLTVCLVVLGRHVPQFEFLEVLFGNQQALDPRARIYQRLLAGDPDEATDHAEEFLEEGSVADFYDRVGIPALLLGERDRSRGVLDEPRKSMVANSAMTLVANLADVARDEPVRDSVTDGLGEDDSSPGTTPQEHPALPPEQTVELPDGDGASVLCVGGRGDLDDAAAAMLAQVLRAQGATVMDASFADLDPARIHRLELAQTDTVVVGFLNANSLAHARIIVRRLKRIRPGLRIGIAFWSEAQPQDTMDAVGEQQAHAVRADFVRFRLIDTVVATLADTARPATRPQHEALEASDSYNP